MRSQILKQLLAVACAAILPLVTGSVSAQVNSTSPPQDYRAGGSVNGYTPPGATGPPSRVRARHQQMMQQGPGGITGQMSRHYVPQHLRVAQNQDAGTPSQEPTVLDPNFNSNQSATTPDGSAPSMQVQPGADIGEWQDEGIIYHGDTVIPSHPESYPGGYYSDPAIGGNYFDAECSDCGSIGCDGYACPPANDCRDCVWDDSYWHNGFGSLFYNAEYFAGAHGFTSPGLVSIDAGSDRNSSFGFHGGINIGIPLRKLTHGLLSSQLGVNLVQSNFDGSPVGSENRQQTFVTAGFFRRVDYGLQFGAVVDYMRESWFANLEVAQVRADLSWVLASGNQLGFRYAESIQNESGLGDVFGNLNGTVRDTYRIYYQHLCPWGGYNEFFLGGSDESDTVLGAAYDLPLNQQWALRTGFTYLAPSDDLDPAIRGQDEAWNVQMGVAWRPRGRNWYKYYHRPLLPVADNGSMILTRQTGDGN